MFENIRNEGNQLVITTSLLTRAFTLFSYKRHIVIDPDQETISIMVQILYFFVSRVELKFSDLWYLEYEYEAVETKDNTADIYIASVVTHNKRKYKLFKMEGEKSSHLGLGVSIVKGSDDEPRELVVKISRMLGIPIGEPLPENLKMDTCVSCGRTISAVSIKCLYCGTLRPNAGK